MTTTLVTIWTIAKHWPAIYWALLGCLVLMIILWFLSRTSVVRETKTVEHVLTLPAEAVHEKSLNLKLIPHAENDESAYLEVRNQGDTISVSAQLQIVGLSTGDKYKTWPFAGEWKCERTNVGFYDRQPEPYTGEVRIERNKSRLLTVASVASMVGMPVQEMAIVGINDERVGWEADPRQKQELPYFTIRISLIAKGYPIAKQATFKVGPKTPHGPFEMTEVAA